MYFNSIDIVNERDFLLDEDWAEIEAEKKHRLPCDHQDSSWLDDLLEPWEKEFFQIQTIPTAYEVV